MPLEPPYADAAIVSRGKRITNFGVEQTSEHIFLFIRRICVRKGGRGASQRCGVFSIGGIGFSIGGIGFSIGGFENPKGRFGFSKGGFGGCPPISQKQKQRKTGFPLPRHSPCTIFADKILQSHVQHQRFLETEGLR
ncbi:MAG: hypothetical protein SPK03_00195 [Alloprevotella sp.]|nr:hypothetical protein [Alloprevotella sp.]